MPDENKVLLTAEAIAHNARREEIERLVQQAERSNDATLLSLASIYRRLSFGYY